MSVFGRLGAYSVRDERIQIAVKQVTTSRDSTDTLADDPELIIPVQANHIYSVTILVWYSGDATPDIKFTLAAPAGATGGFRQTNTSPNGVRLALGTAVVGNLNGAEVRGISLVGSLQTAGTAGNISIQWAQNASDANAVSLLINSILTVIDGGPI